MHSIPVESFCMKSDWKLYLEKILELLWHCFQIRSNKLIMD